MAPGIAPDGYAILDDIFAAIQSGLLFREGVLDLLEQALTTGRAVSELLPKIGASEALAADQARIAGQLTGPRYQDAGRRQRRAMGLLMHAWRGRVAGAIAANGMADALQKVLP